jgi:pilus assembly protein CpaB
VSRRGRRRRAALLLALALACGGLAASEVHHRVQTVEARVGSPVPVAVVRRDLPAGARIRPADVSVRAVPARFAPPDALAGPGQVAGLRTAVPVAAGAYLTQGALGAARGGPRSAGGPLRPGERAVEVAVAGGEALSESVHPGSRVDVLVSSEPRAGGGRTELALEDVELLGLRAGGPGGEGQGSEGASQTATAVAVLRVATRQAVYLTAAQNFAREVRLLPRPPGDRDRAGREAIEAGQL